MSPWKWSNDPSLKQHCPTCKNFFTPPTTDEKEENNACTGNNVLGQKTEIDFEGVEVEGELVKPQGSLLLERKHAKFNPMIKLRTDFDDLMEDSVEEIK